jgi:REP element-mobilizing transposase RayT
MSIYRRFPSRGQPSFVTTNTYKRAKLFSLAEACELLISIIYQVRAELQFMLLAFVIMPDHFHLVVLPPEDGPARMMQLIKGRFARSYNLQAARDGPVWQSRYHERIL